MVEPKDPSLGASGPEGDARVGRPLLIAARFRRKAKGLLFSPEHAGALLLAPCNDVHTAGMRHRLDIAFVDAQGLVLEAHRDVGPCRSATKAQRRLWRGSRPARPRGSRRAIAWEWFA